MPFLVFVRAAAWIRPRCGVGFECDETADLLWRGKVPSELEVLVWIESWTDVKWSCGQGLSLFLFCVMCLVAWGVETGVWVFETLEWT